MRCPSCGGQTRTVKTKRTKAGVRRSRSCLSCGERIHSIETVVDSSSPLAEAVA